MKSILSALAVSVAAIVGLSWYAQAQQHVWQASITPLGFCQLSGVSPAAGLSSCTGGIPTGAVVAWVIDESTNTRWRDDGTNPTASSGMLLASGNWPPMVYNGDLTKIKFVAVSGTPVLDIAFYGKGY
ncbi:MAG TPA: hypothetical protein VGR84_18905 [Candidatus Acidoferrales bacterium]|nr:hypothetical protein [Candidatus Acidoferrales bacterium]